MSTRPPKLPTWASGAGDNVQPTNGEITSGWPESQTPPSRQRFNWFFNLVMNGVQYLVRRGISDWASDEDYVIGDKSMGSDLKTYIAIQPNTNKDPVSETTYWAPWALTQDDADERYALKNGDETERFMVARAENSNEAIVFGQVLPTGEFSVTTAPGTYPSAITIPPYSKVRVFMQGGGGGGGASDEEGIVSQDATNGGNTSLIDVATSDTIVIARGGGRGQNATRYGNNTYLPPTTPVENVNVEFPTDSFKRYIFTATNISGTTPSAGSSTQLQKPTAMNGSGGGGAGNPGQVNIAGSSSGNGGSFFEGVIVNASEDPMVLTLVVGAGGLKTMGVWGNGVDGLPGSFAIQFED